MSKQKPESIWTQILKKKGLLSAKAEAKLEEVEVEHDGDPAIEETGFPVTDTIEEPTPVAPGTPPFYEPEPEVLVEEMSHVELDAHNEAAVEEHIIQEPEQVIVNEAEYLEVAQAGVDTFEEVVKEMPDDDPTPRPEPDAILTNVEVKAVKAEKKKKGGRPRKNKA